MTDLSNFNPNNASNPNNNIFGLPFTEEEARLVILPVPWEVTVSYRAGTSRAPEHIMKASLQVELLDNDLADGWRQGIYMREPDRKLLMKSDYLRKEAELYINYIAQGENVDDNKFMCKALKEVNAGSRFLNDWVYEQCKGLLEQGKLVGLLGGDHSTPLGYMKALAERYPSYAVLQVDAHCDLRPAYEGFEYSHASVMFNALQEIPAISKLVQVGVRDLGYNEWDYIRQSNGRVVPYFDRQLKERLYENESWKHIADDIIDQLPQHVYVSFDIDGLDPKLCPHTGTPVMGGLESEQAFYLFRRILRTGRTLIGFDLVEVGISNNEWDENVGARVLYKLVNLLLSSN
ncbi:MAG TPA: agmatinase family protein [Lacibacter sp.]|nr:agmatinase family protein [Lacibacter sp.]HMO89712.1 agmatinase family protein [Lacibacter sp.]HMP86945.1 agmatinase family protein [Lacibacter sp.]